MWKLLACMHWRSQQSTTSTAPTFVNITFVRQLFCEGLLYRISRKTDTHFSCSGRQKDVLFTSYVLVLTSQQKPKYLISYDIRKLWLYSGTFSLNYVVIFPHLGNFCRYFTFRSCAANTFTHAQHTHTCAQHAEIFRCKSVRRNSWDFSSRRPWKECCTGLYCCSSSGCRILQEAERTVWQKGKSVKQSAHILTVEEFSVRLWICTRFHSSILNL
jgi:hypothetical protein